MLTVLSFKGNFMIASPPSHKPYQVLLVEDNLADASIMRRLFSRLGEKNWQMLHVETLQNAIDIYEEYARLSDHHLGFDLILLDLNLSDSMGLDTLQKLRQALPKVPVVVMTSLGDQPEHGVRAIAAGAQDYLVKDQVSIGQLTRAMEYGIERYLYWH
jgi:CheY-like chemotaxis protein